MSSLIVLLTLAVGAGQAQESERVFSFTDYGTIKNVTFRNIKAEGMGRFGIMLEGRSDSKIQNVVFDDV